MSCAKVDMIYLRGDRGGVNQESDATRESCREPDVRGGRELQQALLVAVRDVERADERVQGLPRDAVLAPRERLELLVGLFAAVAAHHGLDRLGQHLPGVLEVLAQAFGA